MEAARPPRRRRRRRRSAIDRPLDARLVRIGLLVVVPAVVALLLSVSPARPLPPPPLAPSFDAASAASTATAFSTAYPSRVPGTPEAVQAAHWYEETVASFGLPVEAQVWREDLAGLGVVELHNLVTVVRGRADEAVLLVAHRDNSGEMSPADDNASGTAALIEIARSFGSQAGASPAVLERTLILVSTDAGAYGAAGAAHFASHSPYAAHAIAALVVDDIRSRDRTWLLVAGDDSTSPSRTLVATAAARISEQTGLRPLLASAPSQLVGLGIPYAAGEQGPLLGRGIAALTITTAEVGNPDTGGATVPPLAVGRYGRIGNAVEALLGSLDVSVRTTFRTADSLFIGDRVASGWVLRLTLVVTVVPFALGVLDLSVRSRRRRLPLAPAVRALRTRLLFWLYCGCMLALGALTGVFPTGAPLALPPTSSFVTDPPTGQLAALGGAAALGWLVGRRRLAAGPLPSADERLAGYTVALVWLTAVAIVLALVRPYGLLFVLPSLYAWLWLPLAGRAGTRAALYLLGLAGPLVGLVVLASELDLGLLDCALYVLALATVRYVSIGSVLFALAWLAAAAQLGALAFGRYRPHAGRAQPGGGVLRTTVGGIAGGAGRRYSSGR